MGYEPGWPCHSGSGPGLCPLLSLGPREGTGARGGRIGCVSETALGRRKDTAWASGDHAAALGTVAEEQLSGPEAEGSSGSFCACETPEAGRWLASWVWSSELEVNLGSRQHTNRSHTPEVRRQVCGESTGRARRPGPSPDCASRGSSHRTVPRGALKAVSFVALNLQTQPRG